MSTPPKNTLENEVDAVDEVDDGMIEVVNTGGMVMKFNLGRRPIALQPGQKTRVEKLYGLPQSGQNPKGDPVPSTVEMLTDGNVVASSHRKARPFYKNEAARKIAYPTVGGKPG